MFGFVAAPVLPTGRPLSCIRQPPTCKTRRSSRKGSPRGPRTPRGRLTGKAGAVPSELADQFEEDVKERLVPGKKSSEPAKPSAAMQMLEEFDVRKMTREQALEFLVKGAWAGIGILVGYFLVVHFVIVKDLVPH